jgi:predicted DNA-binding transcriptional regulator AlpA
MVYPTTPEEIPLDVYFRRYRTRQTLEFLGFSSRTTLWNAVKEGRAPKPRYDKPHSPYWRLGDLITFEVSKTEAFEDRERGSKGDPTLRQKKPSPTKAAKIRSFLKL